MVFGCVLQNKAKYTCFIFWNGDMEMDRNIYKNKQVTSEKNIAQKIFLHSLQTDNLFRLEDFL